MSKKRDTLIPKEKSEKVIRLEKRGQRKEKISIGSVCFAILAVLCLIYFVYIAFFINYGTKFFVVWGVLAVVFGVISIVLSRRKLIREIPKWIKVVITVCFILGVLFFGVIEFLICNQFTKSASPGADYIIVLGAKWEENGPSFVLKKRLDKAIEYLDQNPDTKVIVSGGQGRDESIPEALGMHNYLVEAGITSERILMEDRSHNTYENLSYSGELINKKEDKVALITNNYHVFRTEQIAKKLGYAKLQGIAVESGYIMVPNNLLREFLGILKDFWIGYI